jgi:hypothetical protein
VIQTIREATDGNVSVSDEVAIEKLAAIHGPNCGVMELRNMVELQFRIIIDLTIIGAVDVTWYATI